MCKKVAFIANGGRGEALRRVCTLHGLQSRRLVQAMNCATSLNHEYLSNIAIEGFEI